MQKSKRVFSCSRCGKQTINKKQYVLEGGDGTYRICDDCIATYNQCGYCDTLVDQDRRAYKYKGKLICVKCRNRLGVDFCKNCGELKDGLKDQVLISGPRESTTKKICSDCLSKYSMCECCGALCVPVFARFMGMKHPYCGPIHLPSKWPKENPKLGSHKYKPRSFGFFPTRTEVMYFGIELEINDGSNGSGIVDYIFRNYFEHFYCVYDGSLNVKPEESPEPDYSGFEVVSMPATLDYHIKEMEWRDILSLLIENGYTSETVKNKGKECGIHVHTTRSAWSNQAIINAYTFINYHKKEICALSGRVNDKYAKFKKREDGGIAAAEKYDALNVTPRYTIEFRMFNGTLEWWTLMAYVEAALCIYKFAMATEHMTSAYFMVEKSWIDFMKTTDCYPYLSRLIHERITNASATKSIR